MPSSISQGRPGSSATGLDKGYQRQLSRSPSLSALSETPTFVDSADEGLAYSEPDSGLDPKSTERLSVNEWKMIIWMRSHPGKPFTVDAEGTISPSYEHPEPMGPQTAFTVTPRRNNPFVDYETVDLTNEPPFVEEDTCRSRRKGRVAPGSFCAVGGSQRIFTRNSDRSIHSKSRSSLRQGQSATRGLRSMNSSTQYGQGTNFVAASVLQGASNFRIDGAIIEPGAFCAVGKDQIIGY